MFQALIDLEAATQQDQPADKLSRGDHPPEMLTQEILAKDDADLAAEDDAQARFDDRLLTALATMAVRSKRRQADLAAALRRSAIDTDPHAVGEALGRLEQAGLIEQIVPLYDGGVLMSVTTRGIERLSLVPRWALMDTTGAPMRGHGAGMRRG